MDVSTPLDAEWHLRAELTHLLNLLTGYLSHQRRRGRTPAGDIVRGMVIEEGEAEGLIAQLTADWDQGQTNANSRRHQLPTQSESVVSMAEATIHQGAYLPLRHAQRVFELAPVEYLALLLALSAEIDPCFGRLYAYLNDHVGHTRPTLGLALSLGHHDNDARETHLPGLIRRPFLQDGLLTLRGDAPLPGRELVVTSNIANRLTQRTPQPPNNEYARFYPIEMGLLDRLVLPAAQREAMTVWAGRARRRESEPHPLLFVGRRGSGRATLARAAAFAAGLDLIAFRLSAPNLTDLLTSARRDARWFGAAVLMVLTGPDIRWHALWSTVADIQTPVMISVTPDLEHAALDGAPPTVNPMQINTPDASQRQQLWRHLMPREKELNPEAAAELAIAFRFGPGRIAQTIQRARANLAMQPDGKRWLTPAALKQSARAVGNTTMGSLAQWLACPYHPEDLVVPPAVQTELDLALAWAQNQHKVLSRWGFERRMPFGWGLRALFSGPSGTGKTMAAQVLTRQLDLDLYRIDLSQTVSKYIGETEKNLSRLFDEAHQSGAVLFFDEADALFGKRSEVKDAHDRYANIEIGYLLQRMEIHDGIVILATNRRQDMDEAFIRRFDCMVDFPMPGMAERLRIWKGMFPEKVKQDADLQLDGVARKFELSGGEIRNAALASAYLAASEGRPIGMRHIKHALRREMLKSGRVVDQADIDALK